MHREFTENNEQSRYNLMNTSDTPCKNKNVLGKARRTRRGKCSAKWHECHFAQQNSRRVRMIFAEEILICAAEENIYRV